MDPKCQCLWSTLARTTSWAWKNCRKPTTRHGLGESDWLNGPSLVLKAAAKWSGIDCEAGMSMPHIDPDAWSLGMRSCCHAKWRFVTLHPLPARKSRNSLQRRKQNSKSLTRKRRVHFALIPSQDRNPQTSCAYISSSWLHFSIPCVQSCKEQLQGTWEGRCDSLLPSESRP